MIVYGDNSIEIGAADLVAALKRRFIGTPPNLDEARARLVMAGQLEQAAEDRGVDWAAHCRTLTALAAGDFIARMQHAPNCGRSPLAVHRQLDVLGRALKEQPSALEVRTPEGFAWYALYPDAYAQAGEKWAQMLSASTRVLVIGIRSIGTTLAAAVAAALRLRGLLVHTITVRPHGHPYRRSTVLPADLPVADRVIIADEGPGRSGSSMASVAEALVARGYPRRAITFFPGHGKGPGPAASEAVRRCWAQVSQMLVPWDGLYLGGRPAIDAMAELAQSALRERLAGPLQDVAGGLWRALVPERIGMPHGLAPFLEQAKLFARGPSKAGVLLKFAGFALMGASSASAAITTAEAQAARLQHLADLGWTVSPASVAHGWIALPWIEGARFGAAEADADCLRRLGTYIREAAGPPLADAERQRAFERLRHMLVCNTRELLGEVAAQRASRVSDAVAQAVAMHDLPSYGDGRMAPHEWIRSGTAMLKANAAGQQHGHTVIGAQPILWDIAGASVDWALRPVARHELARVTGVKDSMEAGYFRVAYAAFRAGAAKLGAELLAGHPADRRTCRAALRHYRRWLHCGLLRLDRDRKPISRPAQASAPSLR